jgi:hypothetical protein
MPHRISQEQTKITNSKPSKTTCMIEPINTTEKTNTYLSCRDPWWVTPPTDRNQNLAHGTAGQNLDVDELGLPARVG